MEIVEFLKKNLIVIGALVLTLVLTGVFFMLIKSSEERVNEYKAKVQDLKKREKAFSAFPWALKLNNQEIAKDNQAKAEEEFQKLRERLSTKFELIDYSNEDVTPVRMMELLLTKIRRFKDKLQARQVQTSLTDFTFRKYVDGTELPNPNDIPLIRKQLDVVEEIIDKISLAQLKSLEDMRRGTSGSDNLKPEKRELYAYTRYRLNVTGNYEQIQNFVNLLNSSRYCFIVEKVTIESTEDQLQGLSYPTLSGAGQGSERNRRDDRWPGPGSDSGQPATGNRGTTPRPAQPSQIIPKPYRLVFKELTTLKSELVIDYVEFPKPESANVLAGD